MLDKHRLNIFAKDFLSFFPSTGTVSLTRPRFVDGFHNWREVCLTDTAGKNKWSREMRKEGRAKSKKACTKGGAIGRFRSMFRELYSNTNKLYL